MRDSLLNQSAYGDFLNKGSQVSYEEYMKRSTYAMSQLQLQSVQLNNQEMNYQLNLAKQQAQQADLQKIADAQRAIYSFQVSSSYQRQLNSLSNKLTKINQNVLKSNAVNLQASAVRDLQNAAGKSQAAVGQVYNQFGGSDIMTGTGSALDVADYISSQAEEAGYNQYNNKMNQVNDQLAKSLQLGYSQSFENLSLDSKLYLEGLSVNRTLNG